MKKTKQKIVQTVDSIEAIKSLPGEAAKAAAVEGKNLITGLWKQALRPDLLPQDEAKDPQKGELKPGEELDLRKKAEQPQLLHVEAGINYAREIVHAEKKVQAQEQHQTKVRIQEILVEIKKLTKSSSELAVQFKNVQNLEYVPQDAGKYHANFVEWVLSMLRSARERVDNAASWTSALKSKKNQKQYWNLFKKHGTSFGLSSERVVATQVG